MLARIALIIPLLNEESLLSERMAMLRQLDHEFELVFVDGGSSDRTIDLLRQNQLTFIAARNRGRGIQIAKGALHALPRCDVVLFLHIDTKLPTAFDVAINQALETCDWGFFNVHLDSGRFIFTIIQFMMNIRSRLTGIATGDQCIFVRSETLQTQLEPLKQYPLMEDIFLSRELKKICGRGCIIHDPVTTSVRYWQKRGIFRTIMKMWKFRFLFYIGINPGKLYSRYYN